MDNSISDMFSTSDIFNSFTANSDYEHLRIIFEDVLCTVSFVDVEEIIFKEEIPKLKQACNDVIEQVGDLVQINDVNILEEIKNLIEKYVKLLDFAVNSVKYISKSVHFTQIRSLPLPICEILLNAFTHCKESDNFYGDKFSSISLLLSNLFKKANELQSNFLKLLNHLILFNFSEESHINTLVEVIKLLSKIGEIVSKLDIKTGAELWKGYMIISQNYKEYLKDRVNIDATLKYFCHEVIEALDSVKNTSELKAVEKILKISNFNLKIIIKLCGIYDYLGDSYQDLFNLLIILNSYHISYLQLQNQDKKVVELMQLYIVVAAEPLLFHLINKREFLQQFYKDLKNVYTDKKKRIGALFLTVSIIKKILNGDPELFRQWIINDINFNIITILFDSFHLFHAEFLIDLQIQIPSLPGDPKKLTSLYEFLLIHTSAVVININEKHFKIIQKLICKAIIQNNFWKAVFASDVWCIIARYGTAEFCYEQLIFLISIFLKIQNISKPELIYLKCLISRLYNFLNDKYKEKFLLQYPLNEYKQVWASIEDKNHLFNAKIGTSFIENLIQNIEIFINTQNINHFEKIVEDLEVLLMSPNIITTNNQLKSNVASKITELWMLNFNKLPQNSWMLNFVYILARNICNLIKIFNNQELLKILQVANDLDDSNLKIKLLKCHLLNSLSSKYVEPTKEQIQIFNIISKIFNSLLKDKNPLIKQTALETFNIFAHNTTHETILPTIVDSDQILHNEISNFLQKIAPIDQKLRVNYFKYQSKLNLQHTCVKRTEFFIEPVQKKSKHIADLNIDIIMHRIKNDIESLSEYYKNEKIPENISSDLLIIINRLQNIIS